MITLNCPLCGSRVRSPSAQPYTRFVCTKCHSPLHVSKAGDAVVGEPPDVETEVEAIKQQVREKLEKVPVRRVVTIVAAVLVLGLAVRSLLRPPQPLKEAAEQAAQAFAKGDVATLKALAAPGTAEDVARWYEEVHPRLVQERARWQSSQGEAIDVHVAREDRAGRRGSAGASIHPTVTSGLDVSLADPTAATATADTPVDLDMEWTLSRWGRWKIDGRATYAKLHPSP